MTAHGGPRLTDPRARPEPCLRVARGADHPANRVLVERDAVASAPFNLNHSKTIPRKRSLILSVGPTPTPQRAFEDRHGIALDPRALDYVNAWLRTPDPLLPLPDLRWWYRNGLLVPLSCAVAYDSDAAVGTDFAGNTTPWTTSSFTNTAGDFLILFLEDQSGLTNAVSGATYNGVTMDQIETVQQGIQIYAFILGVGTSAAQSPATGAHTFGVTKSGNALLSGWAISYSGTAGNVDGHDHNTVGAAVQNHIEKAITTTVTNSWTTGFFDASGFNWSAGTAPSFLRHAYDTTHAIIDSNGGVAIGSNSLQGVGVSGFPAMNMLILGVKAVGGGATFGPEVFQPISQPTNHYRPTIVM